ncbi:MAG: hypothetical protein KatS3mg034_1503 [Vicingaceae bacterium]|jgi:ribosome-binding factor A|nr:MAG: hypothetical protein KatS3mg034_1503 [Vicingaceae bacterium]
MTEKYLGKINKLLQTRIAEIINLNKDLWFEKAFITVTRVSTTSDLSLSKVYLSILNPNKQELLDKIKQHKGEIKKELGLAIRNKIRKIPDLQFILDDTLDYIEEIDRLLKK